MAEGETQYNIPVSSKQLIVYFVFLVIALSAAFLAGVMVGRNVDSSPQQTVRDIQDVVQEEPVASPTPDALTYGSTLAGDKVEGLSPAPGTSATPVPQTTPRAEISPSAAAPSPTPLSTPRSAATPSSPPPRPTATAARPAAKPTATPRATPKPSPRQSASARPAATPLARLTIQVGAFKERAAAEAIVKRLKGKGYSAYLVPVSEGLFNVRVGSFTKREDAERILAKLETQEKFKPFIVKP
ncbi:MAG: SPOR domain-containing protein [Vicinamibacteria bacterium]|nr:SPOR domain-containing protein [Vicinamibacteria bacterium]MBP9944808.1 SPOR domain-containing protein [Vicinamibacteria bacterium]